MNLQRILQRSVTVLATVGLAVLGGCDSGGGGKVTDVQGLALSVLNDSVQASRDFVVNDLSQPPESAQVAEGTSDSNGVFSFQLKGIKGPIYVVFPPRDDAGEPRTSGLVALDQRRTDKTLRDQTDVACVAGVTAVLSGALAADQLTAERIANLEAAAQQVIEEDGVDFTSAESVGAAAAKVRELTNDGANPPG